MRLFHPIYLTCFLLFTSPFIFADQLIIEPDMGRQPIQNVITHSKNSLRLVMYGLTDKSLLDNLIQQKQSGKSLKVLLEKSPYKIQNENDKAIQAFSLNHIDWHGEIPSLRFIHQKTLIIDGRKMIIMTFNFTKSSFTKERNFALIVDDPQKTKEVESVFSADWNHVTTFQHSPDLIYSPDNSRRQIATLIKGAKKSIKIYAQSISDYKTVGLLAQAAHNGVQIEILTSSNPRTKALAYLTKAGVTIHQSRHYYIHAKVMIIDNLKAMLGSINLTRNSLDDNRELAMVTRDPDVINQLNNTFKKDCANAT